MRFAHDCGRAFARSRRSTRVRPGFIRPTVTTVVCGSIIAATFAAACTSSSRDATGPIENARSASAAARTAAVAYPLVAIQPAVTTMVVGARVTLLAKLTAGNGATWMGKETGWKSSDATILSVTEANWGKATGDQGVVTALKAGKATVTATTQSGTSRAITITVGKGSGVVTPPILAGSLHEPAGMTTQFNTGNITSFAQSGLVMVNGPTPSVVPGSSGLRVMYTPILAGGYSPEVFGTGDFTNQGTGWLYMRMQIRFSSNWTTNGNATVKLCEPHTLYENGGPGGPNENHIIYGSATDFGSTKVALALGLQGPNGQARNLHPTSPAAILSDGRWHTMEVLLGPESSAGAGNGTYQGWVDGVQIANYSNVHYLAAGQTRAWKALLYDPTYGGGTASPPDDIYWDMNQLFVSTK
jgi:Bacterial Ig-like domain (group 2)